jgi:phosphoribosylaminoimidazole carboxylase
VALQPTKHVEDAQCPITEVPACATDRVLGVLGGGQLGRMMAYAAHRLGVRLLPLDPKGSVSPAGQAAAASVKGSFQDAARVRALGSVCDVLTVEIEHIDTQALEALEAEGKDVQPRPSALRMIQDKFRQKEHFQTAGVPLGEFRSVSAGEDVLALAEEWGGFPVMLKSRLGAYDGKGNAVVRSADGVDAAWRKLGGHKGQTLYAERWVPFRKELAVMVARGAGGEIAAYPVVETVQVNNVCSTTVCPVPGLTDAEAAAARAVASRAIASVDGRGIYGVELFLLAPDRETGKPRVLLNEVAPRPHNSGHYTIEACHTDQFENHLRAVLGLPLGDPSLKVGASAMVNVLGAGSGEADLAAALAETRAALEVRGATMHWYGKQGCRAGRKMAHVSVVAPDAAELERRMQRLRAVQRLRRPVQDQDGRFSLGGALKKSECGRFSRPDPATEARAREEQARETAARAGKARLAPDEVGKMSYLAAKRQIAELKRQA